MSEQEFDVSLDETEEASPETPEEQTPEERLKKAEEELEKFRAFQPFVDAIDHDPSKVYDLRAALANGARVAEAPREEAPTVDKERLREYNAKLKEAAIDPDADFLGLVAGVASQIADEKIASFRKDAEPYTKSVGENQVQSFKREWKDDENPAIYREASRVFDEELARLDFTAIGRLSSADREYQFRTLRDAAVGRVLRAKVKNPSKGAANIGRGGGTVSGPKREPEKSLELTEQEQSVLIRNLGQEEGQKAIARIEAGE